MAFCMSCLTGAENLASAVMRVAKRSATRVAMGVVIIPVWMFSWTSASADELQVVTDIAPVHSLVARVMEGVGEPAMIMARGANAHTYNMRPSDASKLNDADVLFWIGPSLTPWLEKAVRTLDDRAISIELMQSDGTTILENRQDAAFSHSDDEHNDGHAHEHGEFDPHGWFDPENAKLWLDRIAAELTRLDPANADVYNRNALTGQQEIDTAIEKVRSRFNQLDEPRFIVYHDAYQYFSSRFDLPTVGAISISDSSRPSVSRMAEVRNLFTRENVNCVIVDPLYNKGLVQAITGSVEARIVVIDPLAADFSLSSNLYTEWLLLAAEQLSECLS